MGLGPPKDLDQGWWQKRGVCVNRDFLKSVCVPPPSPVPAPQASSPSPTRIEAERDFLAGRSATGSRLVSLSLVELALKARL